MHEILLSLHQYCITLSLGSGGPLSAVRLNETIKHCLCFMLQVFLVQKAKPHFVLNIMESCQSQCPSRGRCQRLTDSLLSTGVVENSCFMKTCE